jgi:hypothetical protein
MVMPGLETNVEHLGTMLAEILLVLTNLFELNTQVTRRKGFQREKNYPVFSISFRLVALFESPRCKMARPQISAASIETY